MKAKNKLLSLVFAISFLLCVIGIQMILISSTNAEGEQESETPKSETTVQASNPPAVQTVGKIVKCKNYIYVYKSASLSSKKLGKAVKGAEYVINTDFKSGKWYKIDYKGKTGYVRKYYVSVSKKPAESPEQTGTPAEPPSETPKPTDGWYTVDNAAFGIDSTGANARATTDGINNALRWAKEQGYNKIKFVPGTYMIQCKWNNRFIQPTDGILVPSGLTLDLTGSTFSIEPNGYAAYCVFAIVNSSNITIKGGTIIGDVGKHKYTASKDSPTHEWGFGIIVSAGTDVTIKGVTIKKTTGDGIILEGSYDYIRNGGRESSNVRITGCDISDCRRQGISVVGAVNSEIDNNKIYNISGTDPQYGIDVEPELDYSVTGLKIHSNTIYGCSGGAISCCKGAGYEAYSNVCTGNNMLAVFCSDVKIYKNTINDSFIRIYPSATNVTVAENILDDKSWIYNG